MPTRGARYAADDFAKGVRRIFFCFAKRERSWADDPVRSFAPTFALCITHVVSHDEVLPDANPKAKETAGSERRTTKEIKRTI